MTNAIRQFIDAVDAWLEASGRFNEAGNPFIREDPPDQTILGPPERDDGTDAGEIMFLCDRFAVPLWDDAYVRSREEAAALEQKLNDTRQEAHQRRQAVLAASQPAAVQLVRQGADATGAAHVARLARDPSFAGPAAVRELWNHVAAALDVAAIRADGTPDAVPKGASTPPSEPTTVAGCLEPIADEYERISRQWGNPTHAEPAPRHVEAMLDKHHFADAVEWLVVHMAVDYGERLEKQVRQPIEMHQRAHFRALQILDDDLQGTSTEATGRQDAIRRAMEKLRAEEWIREDLDDADAESARIRRAYHDLEELAGGLPWAYRQAAEHIRRAQPLLRDKLNPAPTAQPTDVEQRGQGNMGNLPAFQIPAAQAVDVEQVVQGQGKLTGEMKAIMFIQERLKTTGKLPTKKAIAELLEVSDRTLLNWGGFTAAYAELERKHGSARRRARGEKSKDGNLEAWQD